ncbi:Mitochondrial inner membrane protease ATP23, partial [Bienertia sinuspersici]
MVTPNMPPSIPCSISPELLSSRSTSFSTTHQPLEHRQPLKRGFRNLDIGAVKTSIAASPNNQIWQKTNFDDKDEVLTIDAKGNTTLVNGTILPIDVWSKNGVNYFVKFNDLCQPIRKGGHILIRFIGMMVKIETHCLVGEEDWHAIDNRIKGTIVTDKRNLSEYGKKARAFLNKYHRFGSNIFVNQQADYEDENSEKISLLALWIKSHIGKIEAFFVDDVKFKVGQLRLKYHTKSELELENEAFEETMYQDEIPNRPFGYGLGVEKGDIYGVRGVLWKEGYGKVQRRNIVMDSVEEEMTALHKRNNVCEKDNTKMKNPGNRCSSSPELLNYTQELLGMTQQQ